MTTLADDIKRLRELDTKRTPGLWEAGIHPANDRINIVKPIFFSKYVGKLPDCEGGAMYMLHRPNAEYIASMPDAIRTINRLVELVGEMHGALRDRNYSISQAAFDNAENIITKAAPIAALAKGE